MVCRPAHLIAATEEEAEGITEALKAAPGREGEQLTSFDLLGMATLAQAQRERALRKKLEENKNKTARIITAEEFAIAHNNLKLAEIDSPEKIYTAKDTGTDGGSTSQSALKMLEKNCPAGATVRLKAGARVMLLKNLDVERGLANGTMGTVRSLSHGVPIVQFDDIEDYSLDTGVAGSTRVDFATWEVETGGVVLAKRSQIPLRLAYALSVHKSQGQSLSKVAVSLDRAFEPGQSYVAISRARTLEGLYITDGGRHSIFAHPDAVAFYEGIRRAQSTSADRG